MMAQAGGRSEAIFIRVDSSARIGSGHVMRCLNLATELQNNKADIHFICADLPGNLMDKIKDNGFPVHIIKAEDNGFTIDEAADVAETLKIISGSDRPQMIIDHYGISAIWHKAVRKKCSAIHIIDDLADRDFAGDTIINYNVLPDIADKYKASNNIATLFGPRYALLDSRKFMQPLQVGSQRIVIFFGATDEFNLTEKFLRAVLPFASNSKIDVVVGANNTHRAALEKIASDKANVNICGFQKDFPEFLRGAGLLIGAGGSTQMERCALGIPGIVIAIADNQKSVSEGLAAAGAALYLGWHSDVTQEMIVAAIEKIYAGKNFAAEMSKAGASLVDGKGAIRVANAIYPPAISLRMAVAGDREKIFVWRNHPEVRKQSLDDREISWADHTTWFDSVLQRQDVNLFIATGGGREWGVVRLDYKGDKARISVYLNPDLIGCGIGSALIESAASWLQNGKSEISLIEAEIKQDNIRSQKSFLQAGYKQSNGIFIKELR